MTTPWEALQPVLAEAPYPVRVLPAAAGEGERCLAGLGITELSALGAVVAHSGGILVDHGWLRVLGSGAAGLPDVLEHADAGLVAVDVLGGQFTWVPGAPGQDATIHYFAPDTLTWEDLDIDYSHWLSVMLTGGTTEFYGPFRWPGWEAEVESLALDQAISTTPPLWTADGEDLSAASREPIPLAELTAVHQEAARRQGAGPGRPASGGQEQ